MTSLHCFFAREFYFQPHPNGPLRVTAGRLTGTVSVCNPNNSEMVIRGMSTPFRVKFAVFFHCASVITATMLLFGKPNNQTSILDRVKA